MESTVRGGISLVPGAITHHSIELSWKPPGSHELLITESHDTASSSHEQLTESHDKAPGSHERLQYCVQEEEVNKSDGFTIVYNGYGTHHVFTGLNVLTQYRYRIRATSAAGTGAWSTPVVIATTRQPRSCENLHKAVQRGDMETTRSVLTENALYVDVPDIYGSSVLMTASKLNKLDLVELLLDLGADVEFKNGSGKTSLMVACYHGNLECARALINRGASWLTLDLSGFSALHYAVDGGQVSVVKYALSDGVPVDTVHSSTLSGWTPLMRLACVSGSAMVGRVLIDHGADINRRDREGKGTLMLAALNGFDELVQVLLDNGADPLARTEHGKTALDIAESFQRQGVLKKLQAALPTNPQHT